MFRYFNIESISEVLYQLTRAFYDQLKNSKKRGNFVYWKAVFINSNSSQLVRWRLKNVHFNFRYLRNEPIDEGNVFCLLMLFVHTTNFLFRYKRLNITSKSFRCYSFFFKIHFFPVSYFMNVSSVMWRTNTVRVSFWMWFFFLLHIKRI